MDEIAYISSCNLRKEKIRVIKTKIKQEIISKELYYFTIDKLDNIITNEKLKNKT